MTSPAWVSWIPSNSFLEILGIYPCVETIVPQLILLAITIGTFVYWMKRNKQMVEQAKLVEEVADEEARKEAQKETDANS